ncbi:MAG: carbon-nitrogen hydrolase family protein [Candidatus Nitrosotenuis sp.]
MAKIAVVQLKASTDKTENLQKILDSIKFASDRGAHLCAFPEFMMFYTTSKQSPAELASLAESTNGNFVKTIAGAAKQNKIQVVGTLYEKSNRKDRVFDTSFFITESGRLAATYRKIHLYDALGFKESKKLAAGSKIAHPVKTSIGKMGMLLCYDLRFPEMSRTLASSGSEVLIVPSAWVKGHRKEEHWLTINKTRAIENGCYVIAPDQVGNIYCGRSLVVDPFGKILLDMKKRKGIGFADIAPAKVRQTRKALPLLQNRRTDVYPNLRL